MSSFFSSQSFSNISQSVLGAISVAAYHRYTNNKITKLNNEKTEIKQKYQLFELEEKYKREIDDLKAENAQLKNIRKRDHIWF